MFSYFVGTLSWFSYSSLLTATSESPTWIYIMSSSGIFPSIPTVPSSMSSSSLPLFSSSSVKSPGTTGSFGALSNICVFITTPVPIIFPPNFSTVFFKYYDISP